MVQKARTKAKHAERSHPYSDLEGTLLWSVVSGAIEELVANNDLQETTARVYIAGYIVRKILDGGVFPPE